MGNEVKRYDCTSGGASFCQGCYTMEESEYGDYVEASDYDALRAEAEALRAENGRLHMFEAAYNEWQEKTEWMKKTIKPHELGKHRADVLRDRLFRWLDRIEQPYDYADIDVDKPHARSN